MTIQDEKGLNDFLQKQILQDLDSRNISGFYMYLLAWLLIGAGSEFYQDNLLYYWLTVVIFLLLGLSRIIIHFYFSAHPHSSQTARAKWHYFNVLMPAVVYSVWLSLAFYGPPFDGLFLYILLLMFAWVSAGSVNFAPNKQLGFAFIFTLTIPPVIVAVFAAEHKQVLGLMLALYGVYMLMQARQLNKEYLLRLQQQYSLGQLNRIDSLTGIGNRRQFDESIEALWKINLRSQTTLSLIIMDIDYFKRVNDQFGHAAGDEVIKHVAKIIQSICKRDTDVVSRIGGEEYTVLLVGGDKHEHHAIAESIRSTIEAQEFAYDHAKIRITVSIGIAFTKPTEDKTVAEFFKVADKSLYSAKDSGRNQIVEQNY